MGIFSEKIFNDQVYYTGIGSKALRGDYDDFRDQILREDEEILAIIIAIGSEL